MSLHRYPMKTLAGDYARAGGGTAVTLGPLLFAHPGPVIIAVLGSLAALFLVFGLRTWRRHLTLVEVTEDGITTAASQPPAPRLSIPWRRLSGFKLRYYSTQRTRGGRGWLQMGLSAGDGTLWIDSGLDDFEAVARRAADAALANRVNLGPTTVSNLDTLGIEVPPDLRPVEVGGRRP